MYGESLDYIVLFVTVVVISAFSCCIINWSLSSIRQCCIAERHSKG